MAHRNTAYWPERYTPLELLQQAAQWRQSAKQHLRLAAATAAHDTLAKTASTAARRAVDTPTPGNLNSAGSVANLAADSAARLAEDMAALTTPCPEPPCFAVVYQEPIAAGLPRNWVAEVYSVGEAAGSPVLRTYSSLDPALCRTREQAVADLRELARTPDVARAGRGTSCHAARVRAAIRCALETEPTEVRIRLAGQPRPDGWEQPR